MRKRLMLCDSGCWKGFMLCASECVNYFMLYTSWCDKYFMLCAAGVVNLLCCAPASVSC